MFLRIMGCTIMSVPPMYKLDVNGLEDISIDATNRVDCFKMVRGSREYDPNSVPMHNYVCYGALQGT